LSADCVVPSDRSGTVCAQASVEPSRDVISWFSYWDTLAEPRTKIVEVLPGIQTASVCVCLRNTVAMRQVFRDVLGQPVSEFGFEDAWSSGWLSLFGDGGGSALPEAPVRSALEGFAVFGASAAGWRRRSPIPVNGVRDN
jgi:hypothetical protein